MNTETTAAPVASPPAGAAAPTWTAVELAEFSAGVAAKIAEVRELADAAEAEEAQSWASDF